MKRNITSKNYVAKTMKDINVLSKILKEAYVFDDEDMDRPQMQQGEQPEEGEDEFAMDGQTDEIIDQIRQLALNGIQKYAEDVDNEMYVTFKKIWMMCDKCLSEKDKVEN